MSELYGIVLAAGHGKRMKSSLPKVMHPVTGRPLVYYPITAALAAGAHRAVVVVGHEREQVMPYLARAFGDRVLVAIQHEQNGTGHAAAQALPVLP
ncbi:MAG: bifunctional UDP-N-acetylglucosamine diphosphorylase/glucosamine-1-phosphate N-acetyltransferase GlmU, partial [Deltaproteobacteria bacterium HGW-Deltaproteobacteria-20]